MCGGCGKLHRMHRRQLLHRLFVSAHSLPDWVVQQPNGPQCSVRPVHCGISVASLRVILKFVSSFVPFLRSQMQAMYCASGGFTQPSGACSAGFYCPQGSSSSNQVICPLGAFCVNGSAIATSCSAGRCDGIWARLLHLIFFMHFVLSSQLLC